MSTNLFGAGLINYWLVIVVTGNCSYTYVFVVTGNCSYTYIFVVTGNCSYTYVFVVPRKNSLPTGKTVVLGCRVCSKSYNGIWGKG